MFDFGKFGEKFGYTDDSVGIADAQRDWDIPQTGVLDPATVTVLTRIPRCGMSDAQPLGGTQDKWGLKEVSYIIAGYPTGLGLTKKQIEEAIALCYASWSNVCGLRFVRVGSKSEANIVMDVGRGSRAGFDGPSGVLAWCEIPQGSNFRGQINLMWDMDEAWTTSSSQNGILLVNTTAHEIGHGLGLYHTKVSRQLLNPVYNPKIASPQAAYDVAEVVDRYGAPLAPIPPNPTTPGASDVKAIKILLKDGRVLGADKFVNLTNAQQEEGVFQSF
jgi:hypothetical protein